MTLTLNNVSKSFGAVQVLQNISTQFAPGTVTAIVGDNGAGKSTLLKILSGIHAPNSGSVSLEGRDITASPAESHRKAGIEMVYQDLALAKQHDVVANLFMGREHTAKGVLQCADMKRTAKTELDKLGITITDLSKPVGLLSGGQQQAIAIARAALFDPKVLLLDEPTAALATREVDHVLDLIRQQRATGRIVILVSHRLNDVFAVADRIMVLKHGTVHADTPAAETNLAATVALIVA